MSTLAVHDSGDAAARRAIVDDLDDTLVIEAAAGTGKTTELVNRILRVLATGRATMTQVVAVTFTEKAAGELKLRLRERLEQDRAKAGQDDEVRQRLEDALETLEEAHVNTIHGFCAELLRERPVEACVDPLFVVLTEPQAARLYDRAFAAWLQLALQEPPEGARRALRRTSAPSFGGGGSDGPVDRLRNAGRALAEWRDFPAPWHRPPFDRVEEITRLVVALHQLADLSASAASERDNLYLDTDAVRRLSRQIQLEQQFGHIDLDGWEARLVDLVRDRGFSRTRKGSGYKYGRVRLPPSRPEGASASLAGALGVGRKADTTTEHTRDDHRVRLQPDDTERDVTRTEVLGLRDALFAALQQFKKDADADLAAALQQELAGATANYQTLKTAAGALDFADLLSRTRDLIRRDASVRHHLQKKFTRIFVDEFQDTDPIQADILLLLASDDPAQTEASAVRPQPGKLFIVGDPKQAIYRFRGTDVGTYWRVARQIEGRGGRVLRLTKSYRSVPEIQRFVNAAFQQEMVKNDLALQADYIALSPDRPSDESQPAIVALPVPEPYARRGPLKASGRAIEESLPDAVGAFVAWLVDPKNDWRVAERQPDGSEVRVPIQPRHIAILFRRFVSFGEDVTRKYTNAIEARGVPHLLVGGKAFHGRDEVETIRAALAAIEWPDDELSVFATLKGSLFAIDDEQLLEFRDRFGAFHPFRVPKELGGNWGLDLALTAEPTAQLMPIADALRLLQTLHRGRNYRPVADTITRLLDVTRAHVGFILRPAGEQALANVLHVAELARQYEAGGGISFRGFIDELRTAAESEAAEAPILEESSDGVRLMTVHKAKGLEFPVVILADLTCRLSRNDASRYLDPERRLCAIKIGGWAPHELHQHEAEEVMRDEAEGVRLAYVAATRARDLLVVPALGDEPWDGGWLGPLNRALYPPFEARRTSKRAPKSPAFKSKDSVLQRQNDETASAATVCPGFHTFPDGYGVVWWEPGPGGGLKLGEKPPFGVRREELIVKDVPRHVIADGRTRYDQWRLARQDARDAGGRPSLSLATVREWTAEPAHPMPATADPAAISIVNVTPPRSDADTRPGGAAFGLLVHTVLAQASFDASRADLDTIAGVEARMLGLTDADAEAAADAAERVFAGDVIARARAATARGTCRRETAVACTLDDGTLIEGVVDLAFEEQGRWHVVDFKTDREIDAVGEERYRRQVALYAAAIQQATGVRAEGILVRV
jgi:ATP-dependent exoDNAse (exonuclease V) beta subunit